MSERRASARTCRREPGKSRSGSEGSCSEGAKTPLCGGTLGVYTKYDSCDYTHAEGARVVLTLPVTQIAAKGRGGSGQSPGDLCRVRAGIETRSQARRSGHDAQSDAVGMTPAEKTRAERTVVGLLAALASKSLRDREKAPPASATWFASRSNVALTR